MTHRAPPKRRRLLHLALTLFAGLAIAYGASSCVFDDTQTIECESGLRCPIGFTCAVDQDVCIEDGCGDGDIDVGGGESCDDGNIIDADGCSAECQLENCGDGIIQPGETCDDGNNVSGDGCSADCLSLEVCGNGYTDVGEVCDDGNTADGDGCRGDCRGFEMCGNGIVDTGEDCDNGGNDDSVCDADCTFAECGDGRVNPVAGEQCDPGLGPDTDSNNCDGDCTPAECGDGRTNTVAGEMCDTAGDSPTCDADCTPSGCGDGYVNPTVPEGCDDGNANNNDNCPDGLGGTCQDAVCGDNFVELGVEECDTAGNSATCDADCTAVSCGDGFINPAAGEACDDNNTSDTDACPSSVGACMAAATCGDNFLYIGVEECDTGGESVACDIDCTTAFCGDNVTNSTAGETCDDGNNDTDDVCPSGPAGNCLTATCGDNFVYSGVEQCDDGGESPTCDANCTTASCGDGDLNMTAGEACDDGNGDDTDACPDNAGTCQFATCGDNFVENGVEDCDFGGVLMVTCDLDCTFPACGDGQFNPLAEQCDDNNAVNTDACLNNCMNAFCGDNVIQTGVEECDIGGGQDATCDADCSLPACDDGVHNTDAGEFCDNTDPTNATNDDGCNGAANPDCDAMCMACTDLTP